MRNRLAKQYTEVRDKLLEEVAEDPDSRESEMMVASTRDDVKTMALCVIADELNRMNELLGKKP